VVVKQNHSKIDKNRADNMAFERGRTKTGGRTTGTRNKVNMFDQDTIDKARQVISEQVTSGDIEAAKLVLSYSLSKPSSHNVGILSELEEVKTERELNNINEINSIMS
jgi:hypothetical protein